MRHLFVAISTGQQVANLPPILQFAEKGDAVIWLESELARAQNWSAGAIEVLAARGMGPQVRAPVDGEINDPAAVEKALRSALAKFRSADAKLMVVLNGGQKLSPFGAVLAARLWRDEWKKPVAFLYGEDRRAAVVVREQRIGHAPRAVPYARERMLSLTEILRVNGQDIEDEGRAIALDAPLDPFGLDLRFTRQVYRFYEAAKARQKTRAESACPKIPWPAFEHWDEASQAEFAAALEKRLRDAGLPVRSRQARGLARGIVADCRRFRPRAAARRLLPEKEFSQLAAALAEKGWLKPDGSGPNWGDGFERAVARRVARFLREHPRAAGVVREARMNVRVKEAEWDVALALANGVVLVLECKSGTTEKKEIDARAQNLQRATSRLANIYVVAPFFAELDDEPWFQAEMHNKWQSLQADFGDRLIAFTMRGTAAKDYGATKDGKPIRCEAPRPFEDRLAEILARYAQPAC